MKLIVIGPRGGMGQLILDEACKFNELEIVGAIAPKGRDYVGQDIGLVAKTGSLLNVNVSDDLESIIDKCDVVIDFSTVENSLEVLALCLKYNKKLVNGVTGYTKQQMQLFKDASEKIPFIYAANTSKMVHLMHKVLEFLTENLKDTSDIEIIEMHSSTKLDAPSGTSLEIGHLIADKMGEDFDKIVKFGRRERRRKNEITYHSLRIGNVPSSHSVIFGSQDERLEITHHSYSFRVFARGACECALFLNEKPAGWYNVKEALGVSFK